MEADNAIVAILVECDLGASTGFFPAGELFCGSWFVWRGSRSVPTSWE